MYINITLKTLYYVTKIHERLICCLCYTGVKSSYFKTVNIEEGALIQRAFWSAAASILASVVLMLCKFTVNQENPFVKSE